MGERWSAFRPPPGLRSGHFQSLLSSSAVRRRFVLRRSQALRHAGEVWTLDGGDGIRLQGLYSPQAGESKGLNPRPGTPSTWKMISSASHLSSRSNATLAALSHTGDAVVANKIFLNMIHLLLLN